MIHDVIAADYRGDYKIEVCFDNGKRGVVDFSKYLDKGGAFERFRDLSYFRRFRVDPELGVLTWDGEVDVAPETLYAEATGAPLPEWMISDDATLPLQAQ